MFVIYIKVLDNITKVNKEKINFNPKYILLQN